MIAAQLNSLMLPRLGSPPAYTHECDQVRKPRHKRSEFVSCSSLTWNNRVSTVQRKQTLFVHKPYAAAPRGHQATWPMHDRTSPLLPRIPQHPNAAFPSVGLQSVQLQVHQLQKQSFDQMQELWKEGMAEHRHTGLPECLGCNRSLSNEEIQ